MDNKVMVFSAPSGAGKTTIVTHLLKTFNNLEFSVSATSRAPRGQEVDGKDYYFLSAEEFRKGIAQKKFVEYEEVYPGSFYGTLKSEVERIWAKGNVILFDVDVKGGVSIKKIFGEQAFTVFIQPPSLEVMEQRLRARGTDSEEAIRTRVAKAAEEMTYAAKFDAVLVNDILEESFAKAERLVTLFTGLKTKAQTKKTVALYFGSFNPLHYGHLGIAEYVILNCCIDRFEMVLSPHNPFKDSSMLEDPTIRLAHLKKAIRLFNKQLAPKIREKNQILKGLQSRHSGLADTRNSLLHLTKIVCGGITVNDIEFQLNEPLYTFNTMKELHKRNPDTEYVIVVGADSFKNMPRWHLGEDILREFKVIVYPRKGYRVKTLCRKYKAIYLESAPLNNISSTQIRNGQAV